MVALANGSHIPNSKTPLWLTTRRSEPAEACYRPQVCIPSQSRILKSNPECFHAFKIMPSTGPTKPLSVTPSPRVRASSSSPAWVAHVGRLPRINTNRRERYRHVRWPSTGLQEGRRIAFVPLKGSRPLRPHWGRMEARFPQRESRLDGRGKQAPGLITTALDIDR
ncbi:hypothetical protein OG21DRAFT_1509631 [Imleria badia]|nr:hypothetical protein OG21DRAFT_1509631 [Imleria badia]